MSPPNSLSQLALLIQIMTVKRSHLLSVYKTVLCPNMLLSYLCIDIEFFHTLKGVLSGLLRVETCCTNVNSTNDFFHKSHRLTCCCDAAAYMYATGYNTLIYISLMHFVYCAKKPYCFSQVFLLRSSARLIFDTIVVFSGQ